MFECGYCGKSYPDKEHEDLEELRAEIVKAIYYIENELSRRSYSPNMFLDEKMLKRYRKRLRAVNKKLKEIDDEVRV